MTPVAAGDRDQTGPAGSRSGDPVDVTLASYELAAEGYAARNQAPYQAGVAFMDKLIELLGGGWVLELGSGPGTDADYLERGGLSVIRTDAAVAFVDMMRARG
jgi:hypothetical protein